MTSSSDFVASSAFRGRHVVLGVCGGIAAYKAVELCRRLVDRGAEVAPVLTQSATRFVGLATFAAVATQPPRTTLWDAPEPSPHTTLGRWADVVCVAPATARLIGSYANGLSDDLLATTLLATRAPVVVAPAMHTEMWEHPSLVDNVALLRARGVTIVDPESGVLAGGDVGVGRLAETQTILTAVERRFTAQDLAGVRVLVTAGGTREPIDPVRFLGNRSSGKQGHAVAAEAADRGAEVTLITTANLSVGPGVRTLAVGTAEQMRAAVMNELPSADVIIMAAAVADFRPTHTAEHKLKKSDGVPELRLERTTDILSAIADKRRDDQVVVGFAAETHDMERYARNKLDTKQLDLIVANDITRANSGFERDTNTAIILDKNGRLYDTGLVEKRRVAAILLDEIASRISKRPTQAGEGADS